MHRVGAPGADVEKFQLRGLTHTAVNGVHWRHFIHRFSTSVAFIFAEARLGNSWRLLAVVFLKGDYHAAARNGFYAD